MLLEKDYRQLTEKGISEEYLQWQLSIFERGVEFIKLSKPAVVGDGIIRFSEDVLNRFILVYETAEKVSKTKFVPASGAASRMFKDLFEYLDNPNKSKTPEAFILRFIENIDKFAFSGELQEVLRRTGHPGIDELIRQGDFEPIIRLLLVQEGLGYGNLPKGLLKFHSYPDGNRTPFEEHLSEAARYANTPGQPVNLHFTVSPEHMEGFERLMSKVVPVFEKKFGVTYAISFSIQKPSTDTLAVDIKNQPFRNSDGTMLFRPGGHGALIDNLNALEAEIIFVKNIDNVVPEKYVEPTVRYKKALAGKLLEMRRQVYEMLKELQDTSLTPERAKQIFNKLGDELCYRVQQTPDFKDMQGTKKILFKILNRPIRVCGVVKNLGEPGGGPFWAPNSHGDITLQIIESSQVDHENSAQAEIFRTATHFNPVDLVCCPYDFQGHKFDLNAYVDKSTCFISQKSKDGKELKALELPGLWNGAMADWLTVFVEVPVETFNPVKTVNDLLRKEHQ
jgi:hypothetical protein